MSLQMKIVEDWKQALKSKDPKKDALSMIITELKNRAIKDNIAPDQGRVVSDEIAVEVLQKMAKQRREAIEAYQSAQRKDLIDKEKLQLLTIEHYLPQPLNDDELRDVVQQVIQETGATSVKEMGQVMAKAMKAVLGKADGKRVQAMVQSLLNSQ